MKNRLKELREQRGMSLEDVAKLCDTNRQQMWKLENNHHQLKEPWITGLANAFRVRPRDLFDEDLPDDFHIFTPEELKGALEAEGIAMSSLARVLDVLPAMAQNMTRTHEDGRPKRRIAPDEQILINKLLAGEIADPGPPQKKNTRRLFETVAQNALPAPTAAPVRAAAHAVMEKVVPTQTATVPVYPISWSGEIDWTPATHAPIPPQIADVADVFATYAPSADLSPRYEEGDLLFVSRKLPPRPNDYVLVEGEDGVVSVRQYIGRSNGQATFRVLNPPGEERAPVGAIKGVYRILMSVPH